MPPAALPAELERAFKQHRPELTACCYRMLGALVEAEDAVQETLLRAWRGHERFEGRASLRSWLFRVATRVCLDMLEGRARRIRPVEIGAAGDANGPPGHQRAPETWVEPIPDAMVLPEHADPASQAILKESIRLAFVAALQHLPPRQRAVLLLRDVAGFEATEVGALLGDSVASVNSALQRARATLSAKAPQPTDAVSLATDHERLLNRYIAAFEAYDMDALASMLHEEVVQSMPPYALWLKGPEAVRTWMLGTGAGCRGSRFLPTAANGGLAFGQYRLDPAGGHVPWALHVLELQDGKIITITAFLDTASLFPRFGLPDHL